MTVTTTAVQKEAFPLAGLLSKVMAQTLAKLNRMMANDDSANLTKPHIGKCVTDSIRARLGRGSEGFIAVTMRGRKGFSDITTREELSFVTSTRGEFLESIKKGSTVNAALWDVCFFNHEENQYLANLQVNQPSLRGAVHPFGSMPCCKSSLRASAFSQLPRLTPSRLAASFNCWRNSGVIRIWKVGDRPSPFGVLSLLIVDMYVRNPLVWILLCTYVITAYIKMATPRTVQAASGRLTKPLIEVTVMAGSQHTQTHPKFTWRFLALSADTRNVISITAATEREARDQSPTGCVMVFAGRLPVQEAHHA